MRARLVFIAWLAASSGPVVAAESAEPVLTDGAPSPGLTLMVGDKRQWDTFVGVNSVSSASGFLSVEPDAESGELRASWTGKGEAQLFLAYDGPRDFGEWVSKDSALVAEIKVLAKPRKKVTLKMGCGYPCGAEADIGKLLSAMPEGEWLRVSFDLACFRDGGLDVNNVDVPFLMLTRGKMSLALADVQIVPGVGPDATIRCR